MGVAVVISSHLLALLEDVCSTVLIMHRGRTLLHSALSDIRQAVDESGKYESLENLYLRLTEDADSSAVAQACEE
jgi:ABC-2 type transport system ATP-binding protein